MSDDWQMRALAAEALNSDLEDENERLRVEVATLKARLEGKEPPKSKNNKSLYEAMMREMMESPPQFSKEMLEELTGLEDPLKFKRRPPFRMSAIDLTIKEDYERMRFIAQLLDADSGKRASCEISLRQLADGKEHYLRHVAEGLIAAAHLTGFGLVDPITEALVTLCKQKGLDYEGREPKRSGGRSGYRDPRDHPRSPFQRGGK